MSDQSLGQDYLTDALQTFRDYKELGERAFAQVNDEEFFRTIDEESNSVAVIIKHMAGNMISRWTDFLTSDGEKPDRNRDLEFVITPETSRENLIAYWEKGWHALFRNIEPLSPEDLIKTIKIRGQDHSVVQAINRQLTHYAYHTGQIVFLAKHLKSSAWQNLSVPRNRSAEFNAYLEQQHQAGESTPRSGRLNQVIDFAAKKKS